MSCSLRSYSHSYPGRRSIAILAAAAVAIVILIAAFRREQPETTPPPITNSARDLCLIVDVSILEAAVAVAIAI